jgi:hypothetical protein
MVWQLIRLQDPRFNKIWYRYGLLLEITVQYIVIGIVWQPARQQDPRQSGSRVVEPSPGLCQIIMRNFLARSS